MRIGSHEYANEADDDDDDDVPKPAPSVGTLVPRQKVKLISGSSLSCSVTFLSCRYKALVARRLLVSLVVATLVEMQLLARSRKGCCPRL